MASTLDQLTEIARTHMGIPTLATRRSDHLDFHNVSVWGVTNALEAAFAAGERNARSNNACDSIKANAMANTLPIRYDAYEIHGVREYGKGKAKHCEQVPDVEAAFWSLYGHIPGMGLECIGDFKTRLHAEEIYARITGRLFNNQA